MTTAKKHVPREGYLVCMHIHSDKIAIPKLSLKVCLPTITIFLACGVCLYRYEEEGCCWSSALVGVFVTFFSHIFSPLDRSLLFIFLSTSLVTFGKQVGVCCWLDGCYAGWHFTSVVVNCFGSSLGSITILIVRKSWFLPWIRDMSFS
jgi:hypothetical protein